MIHPNYWGKAAAGVLPLCKKTGRLLLTLRSQQVMEPGTWGIPGGRIMDGSLKRDRDTGEGFRGPVESPEDGGLREFREETFYAGRVQLVSLLTYHDRLSGFRFHNFLGLVSREFSERRVEESWEIDEARWVTLDEALDIEPKHFGLRALLADKASLETIMENTAMRKNPVGVWSAHQFAETDVIMLNAMEAAYRVLLDAATKLRGRGDDGKAERLEVLGEQLLSETEHVVEELEEGGDLEIQGGDIDPSLEEQVAILYGQYQGWIPASGTIGWGPSDYIGAMRRVIQDQYRMHPRKKISDSNIISAARDIYQEVMRHRVAMGGR